MPSAPSLPDWNRAVVKVGSALIAPDNSGCSTTHLLPIARFIIESRRQGKEVILVSSGAVAAGLAEQNRDDPSTGLSIPERQALAAIGQPLLMAHWRRLFDVTCAQVLLTYDDLQRRSRFVNAKNTIAELLDRGTLPIVNENDTVATEELQVGDNDNLAAYVSVLAEADLLVICSDVDGLYTADPHQDPSAKQLPEVDKITEEIYEMVGGSHRAVATGGMQTKVEAAEKATDRGIDTVLVNGTKGRHLDALGRGEMPGTLFRRAERPLSARKHWMLHALPTTGRIVIDAGAAQALQDHGASLLPSGVVAVEGPFGQGDAVEIAVTEETDAPTSRIGKGITQYGSEALRRIQGRQSHAIEDILGNAPADHVVHRDDLVLQHADRDG
ncbi:glutamate 5-kinase [Salinibacter sp. 10B]|uniref:glutamate 5-kinase n=1 Tax=Salinibacter sp. 10B TaxID=1923971 RepID=UPI000CF42A64|nr:glutamate 5-kinase [Salinibacter sp. 10B]PQJ34819.1 glutamate 5-kinase [Salinibacter sp. 10B]